MNLYTELGIRPVINAVGPATRLGGLAMSAEVIQAMQEAGERSVRMDELQEAAGAELARLLGVPAVYVTSGAAAGLSLAAAVCIAGESTTGIDRLPVIVGPRRRIVIQHSHCDPYDHAVTSVGAELTVVGYPGSTRPDELAREFDGTVAAVLWRPGRAGDLLTLTETVELSHQAGVPVIVDAAMDVPPISRLTNMIEAGADLVAVSGGKSFRGPHTSGLLCGRADLIAAVALHHQDMDIRENTWQDSEVTGARLRRGRHGIGRGMKVGREQIAGLLVAVRQYLEDPHRHDAHYETELSNVESLLADTPGLAVRRSRDEHLAVPVVEVDFTGSGLTADEVIRQLGCGTPRIHVGEDAAWRQQIVLNPMGLRPGDGAEIGNRIRQLLQELVGPTARRQLNGTVAS